MALTSRLLASGPMAAELAAIEEQVWRASEGNPFVAVETVRALRHERGARRRRARSCPVASRSHRPAPGAAGRAEPAARRRRRGGGAPVRLRAAAARGRSARAGGGARGRGAGAPPRAPPVGRRVRVHPRPDPRGGACGSPRAAPAYPAPADRREPGGAWRGATRRRCPGPGHPLPGRGGLGQGGPLPEGGGPRGVVPAGSGRRRRLLRAGARRPRPTRREPADARGGVRDPLRPGPRRLRARRLQPRAPPLPRRRGPRAQARGRPAPQPGAGGNALSAVERGPAQRGERDGRAGSGPGPHARRPDVAGLDRHRPGPRILRPRRNIVWASSGPAGSWRWTSPTSLDAACHAASLGRLADVAGALPGPDRGVRRRVDARPRTPSARPSARTTRRRGCGRTTPWPTST